MKILVLSSISPDATIVISPTTSIPMARIQLTHFVEGAGEYYWCVEGYVQSYEENIVRVPNDDFLLNALKTLFRLSRVLLDL